VVLSYSSRRVIGSVEIGHFYFVCACTIFWFILSCDMFVSHLVLSLDLIVMLSSQFECFLCHSIAISSKTKVCSKICNKIFFGKTCMQLKYMGSFRWHKSKPEKKECWDVNCIDTVQWLPYLKS